MNDANMNESMEEGRPPKRPRAADQQPSSQGEAINLSSNFSMMPPEILDKILNKSGLPLREQMSLRAVSPRFRDVIEKELQQKTSLSLIVDSSYKKHNLKPKPDDLIIKIAPFNTEKCIQSIGRLFPRVTKLIMYSAYITAWHMTKYATLISTSRLPRCAHLHLIKCTRTVLQGVSQFKRLRSLTLFFNNWALNVFDSALLQQLRPLSLLEKLNLVNVEYRRPLEAPPSKAFTFPNVTRLTLQLTFLLDFHLDAEHLLLTLATWFPNLSELTLFTYGRFIEEIEANKQAVPYTVSLRKKKLTSHSTFW